MADNYLERKMEDYLRNRPKPFRPVKPKKKAAPASRSPLCEGASAPTLPSRPAR